MKTSAYILLFTVLFLSLASCGDQPKKNSLITLNEIDNIDSLHKLQTQTQKLKRSLEACQRRLKVDKDSISQLCDSLQKEIIKHHEDVIAMVQERYNKVQQKYMVVLERSTTDKVEQVKIDKFVENFVKYEIETGSVLFTVYKGVSSINPAHLENFFMWLGESHISSVQLAHQTIQRVGSKGFKRGFIAISVGAGLYGIYWAWEESKGI